MVETASVAFLRVNRNDGQSAEHHRSQRCRQQSSPSLGICWPCGGSCPCAQVSSAVLLRNVFQPRAQSLAGHAQFACAARSHPGSLVSIPTTSGRIQLGAGVTVALPGEWGAPGAHGSELG